MRAKRLIIVIAINIKQKDKKFSMRKSMFDRNKVTYRIDKS